MNASPEAAKPHSFPQRRVVRWLVWGLFVVAFVGLNWQGKRQGWSGSIWTMRSTFSHGWPLIGWYSSEIETLYESKKNVSGPYRSEWWRNAGNISWKGTSMNLAWWGVLGFGIHRTFRNGRFQLSTRMLLALQGWLALGFYLHRDGWYFLLW